MPLSTLSDTLKKAIDDAFHFYLFRVAVATLCSIGKIGQTAGLNVIGINALFTLYPVKNTDYVKALVMISIVADILSISGTRIPKVYNYFLKGNEPLPSIYLTTQYPLDETLPSTKSYLLSLTDNKLYKLGMTQDEDEEIVLNADGQVLLLNFRLAIDNHFHETAASLFPEEKTYRLLEPALFSEHLRLLDQTNRVSAYETITAAIIFRTFYLMCQLSIPISALYAYLLGVSLCQNFYPKLDTHSQITVGTYVSVSATVSYLLFNLPKMHQGVSLFAKSLDGGLSHGDFGIPKMALTITLLLTVCGIISTVGLSYFLMKNSLDIFPLTQNLSLAIKTPIIFSSAFISLFSSVFSLAFSCFELIKYALKTKPANSASSARYPSYAIAIMLIDSFATTVGGFIGGTLLSDQYLNKSHDKNLSLGLFIINVFCFLNNMTMYFSLAMVGSQQAINAIKNLTASLCALCCLNSATPVANLDVPSTPVSDGLAAALASQGPTGYSLIAGATLELQQFTEVALN